MPSITSPSLSPTTTSVDPQTTLTNQQQQHQHHHHQQQQQQPPIIILSDSTARNTPVEQLKAAASSGTGPHSHLIQTHSDSELFTIKNMIYKPTKLKRSTSESSAGTSEDESESSGDLLNYLKNRQSDEYRYLTFPIQQDIESTKLYSNVVSFDDINLQCDTDDEPEWNDDLGWDLFRLHNAKGSHVKGYSNNYYYTSSPPPPPPSTRGRDSLRSPSPAGASSSPLGSSSPLASPTRRSSSPDMGTTSITGMFDTLDGVIPNGALIQYPSQPISHHKCCSITKQHVLYEALYKQKLPLTPTLPNRTILVYISGRVHTWVALDWILTKFIENGDKIIIVSSVNAELLEKRRKRGRKGSTYASPPKYGSDVTRIRQRTVPNNIMNIARDIMDYCLHVINEEVIAKIVVEIVAGRTKDVLKDMYRLYEPNLVCTGTKPNTNTGAPLRSWNSSKLTDRLVKNFPLPVIVVPAVNMLNFEIDLQQKFIDSISKKIEVESKSGSSINSSLGTSQNDQASNTSLDSYDEISTLYFNYKRDIQGELTYAEDQPISDKYYSDLIRIISDKSLNLCYDIMEVSPDFRGNGSKLARIITGSNSFGVVPYRTKSLLDPVEDDTHKMSFKEVKERLKKNKLQEDTQYLQPQTTSLKFSEPEKTTTTGKGLFKIKSHDVSTTTTTRPKLEPRKSHPGELKLTEKEMMVLEKNNKKNNKIKKKSFWKSLFT